MLGSATFWLPYFTDCPNGRHSWLIWSWTDVPIPFGRGWYPREPWFRTSIEALSAATQTPRSTLSPKKRHRNKVANTPKRSGQCSTKLDATRDDGPAACQLLGRFKKGCSTTQQHSDYLAQLSVSSTIKPDWTLHLLQISWVRDHGYPGPTSRSMEANNRPIVQTVKPVGIFNFVLNCM